MISVHFVLVKIKRVLYVSCSYVPGIFCELSWHETEFKTRQPHISVSRALDTALIAKLDCNDGCGSGNGVSNNYSFNTVHNGPHNCELLKSIYMRIIISPIGYV